MGTKKKAGLNELIPQAHLDFYLEIYHCMEELRKCLPRARAEDKAITKRKWATFFDEIVPLVRKGIIAGAGERKVIREFMNYLMKDPPEHLGLPWIDTIRIGRGFRRSGSPSNFPLNFLAYALAYESKKRTGKPYYGRIADFLSEQDIMSSSDDVRFFCDDEVKIICRRQSQEEMAKNFLACYSNSKDIRKSCSLMMANPVKDRPFFFEFLRNAFSIVEKFIRQQDNSL